MATRKRQPKAQTREELISELAELEAKGLVYTPYGIYSLINRILEGLGVEKVGRPQTFYNYARNGLIVKEVSIKKGTYRTKFSREEVVDFVKKYVEHRLQRVTDETPDES